jgi:hypothetical protein
VFFFSCVCNLNSWHSHHTDWTNWNKLHGHKRVKSSDTCYSSSCVCNTFVNEVGEQWFDWLDCVRLKICCYWFLKLWSLVFIVCSKNWDCTHTFLFVWVVYKSMEQSTHDLNNLCLVNIQWNFSEHIHYMKWFAIKYHFITCPLQYFIGERVFECHLHSSIGVHHIDDQIVVCVCELGRIHSFMPALDFQ